MATRNQARHHRHDEWNVAATLKHREEYLDWPSQFISFPKAALDNEK